ncbi:hypothetical protein DOY81_011820 [Sarcophaga bullata]|nr:hypothetical protein DOY81_011820 [Sarcophaga bullata]
MIVGTQTTSNTKPTQTATTTSTTELNRYYRPLYESITDKDVYLNGLGFDKSFVRPRSQPWYLVKQKPPQQQYLQSSLQSTSLPNYANNIDNYLLNKQPSADYYRTEQSPPSSYLQKQQQPQLQLQYEYDYDTRPPTYQQQQQQQQYDSRPPPPKLQHSQYPTYENVRPPPQSPPPSYFNTQESQYPSYENVRPSFPPPSYVNAQQTQYPSYENVRPPPPGRPSYNNYYDYQIGEIPPSSQEQSSQHFNYPYPRPSPSQYPYQGPYRPTPPPSQQQSGLATLVQYAPQFTSLLLNGVGGGGGSSNSPLGSLLGALTGGVGGGTTPQQSLSNLNRRPVNSQLIKALENIARNDDLQCVPKVLCQMIAGQTERGQLPAFITSPAITNKLNFLLEYLPSICLYLVFLAGFPAASPALIYGRAALLGLSGGEKSCLQTYVKCPKNEYEIIYYLNNHRGGFFKFFSEPEEQQQNVNHDATQQGATSLFSILAALTGTPAATTTTPRPTPKPQAPAADITSGIGNFFTQLLSDYMGGATVEYQRSFQGRRKRSVDDKITFEGESADVVRFEEQNHQKDVLKFHNRNLQNDQENHSETVKFQDENYDAYIDINQDHDEAAEDEDFHDEEDEEDTQQGIEFQDDEEDVLEDTQGRILHRTRGREKRIKFFPQTRENPNGNDKEQQLENIIKKFNDFNRQRKLKFPSESQKREYLKDSTDALRESKTLSDDQQYEDQQYGQKFTNYVENSYEDFKKDSKKIKFVDDNSQEQSSNLYSYYLKKPKDQTKLVFPERQGKILNHPYYAASYLEDYYQKQQQPQYLRV